MNLIAISESGFLASPNHALNIVRRLNDACNDDAVVIDYQTIMREATQKHEASASEINIAQIPFATWLKEGQIDDNIINTHAMRLSALENVSNIILIDASSYRFDLVVEALKQARQAWYPLEKWNPSFVMVCEDSKLLHLINIMASTFYVQPRILTVKETKAHVSQMMVQAFVTRWMGMKVGKLRKNIIKAVNAIIKKTQPRADKA